MSAHTFHESNTYRADKLATAHTAVEACKKGDASKLSSCEAEATKGLQPCASTADLEEVINDMTTFASNRCKSRLDVAPNLMRGPSST